MPVSKPLSKPLSPPNQCLAAVWFDRHFGAALPRGLRREAGAMSWENFVATYGHTAGPLRLGHWACTDADRPARGLRAPARHSLGLVARGGARGRARPPPPPRGRRAPRPAPSGP